MAVENVVELGGKAEQINPFIPSELVVDHSVQVDAYGREDALDLNEKIEFKRNNERYEFLHWGLREVMSSPIWPLPRVDPCTNSPFSYRSEIARPSIFNSQL